MSTLFPPVNSSVTTDDILYPAAWVINFGLILFGFIFFHFAWTYRTFQNIFRNEYFTSLKETELFPSGSWRWVHIWIWPALSFSTSTMFFIWTWVDFSVKMQYDGMNAPRDITAIAISSVCYLLLVVWAILIFYDLYWKYEGVYNPTTAELYKTMLTSKLEKNIVNGELLYVSDGKNKKTVNSYNGLNANTTASIRWVIWVFNICFWGNIPTILGSLVLAWDRANGQPSVVYHLTDWQIWLTFWAGILLNLTLTFPVIRAIVSSDEHGIWEYYPLGKSGVEAYGHSPLKQTLLARRDEFIVGFSSDIFGTRMPVKGLIPVMHVPFIYILARVVFMLSVGFGIWNDVKQALAFWMLVEMLPLLLTLVAQSTVYYIAYETLAMFWFFVLSYFGQSVIFHGADADSINYNLMTVGQSASYPLMTPSVSYASTVQLAYGFSFALSAIAFGVVGMGRPLKLKENDESGI